MSDRCVLKLKTALKTVVNEQKLTKCAKNGFRSDFFIALWYNQCSSDWSCFIRLCQYRPGIRGSENPQKPLNTEHLFYKRAQKKSGDHSRPPLFSFYHEHFVADIFAGRNHQKTLLLCFISPPHILLLCQTDIIDTAFY